ncbi:MAG: type II toxin-antitoxin system VapC family toxin [Candidatus Caldarchaeum sp.]
MEEEKILVLDASVAVKWFNIEPLREKALLVREKYANGFVELITASLLHYEVANALRYNPRFDIEEVKSALKPLQDLGVTTIDFVSELKDKSVETAYRFGITVYDAAYVALALIYDATLFTADEEVVLKTQLPNVKHLSEINP